MQEDTPQDEYTHFVVSDNEGWTLLLKQTIDDPDISNAEEDNEAFDIGMSLLFEFVTDILNGAFTLQEVISTLVEAFVRFDPVIEESVKTILPEKMSMLQDILKKFIPIWINRLREEGMIENEHFAYHYAGLLRDGSLLFQR